MDYDIKEIRKTCARCRGKLDIFTDPDDGKYHWLCNNPQSIWTDEQFISIWKDLPGDDIVRLMKE